jgi:hypothetical protein
MEELNADKEHCGGDGLIDEGLLVVEMPLDGFMSD